MKNLRPVALLKIIPALVLMVSCANLRPSTVENLIEIKDPKEIEGNYSNISSNNPDRRYENFKSIVDHRNKIKSLDSIVSVDIEIIDDRKLRFYFADRQNNKYSYTSKYRLEDGKIKLRNKNFRLTGIPYVLGGYEINKSELSLTTDKNLVIRAAKVGQGAILILLPASLPPSYYENVYLKN